jgi:hypothetical protein
MSDGLREAVEALDEVERRIIHAIETLDPNGSLFHVRAVRAALLANPPQDAGEGLDEARVAAVLAAHWDDCETSDYGEVLWSGCICGHEHPYVDHLAHVAAAIVADHTP